MISRFAAIFSIVLLLILCGCPGNDNQTGEQQGSTPASKAQDSQTADSSTGSTAAATLELSTEVLKFGQRAQISIAADHTGAGLQLRVMDFAIDADGRETSNLLDEFEPLSGPDTMNGWLPQHTGNFRFILEDALGQELDRAELEVQAWPAGDPVAQKMPFVTIHATEVTEEMQLEVGLPLVAYYLVPDDFPHDAWIGLFMVDEEFSGSATADDAIDSALLMGSKGSFNFWPKEAGRYVVRLFCSSAIPASHVVDSQQITVVPESD